MPSYPDPAPHSPSWRAHAAKRRRARANMSATDFWSRFWSRVCPRVGRGGGRLDQNFADPVRRQNPVLPCKSMYGGANAILERTGNSPPTPQSKSDSYYTPHQGLKINSVYSVPGYIYSHIYRGRRRGSNRMEAVGG